MLAWLFGTNAAAAVPNNALKFKHIVCHRGLHDPQLDQINQDLGLAQKVTKEDLTLPVENTLLAYHSAWALGFKYAECDITTTVDDEVFLCHDESFERVGALTAGEYGTQEDMQLLKKQATTLTKAELERIKLRDDSQPPTLLECLELARKMSSVESKKQMVVEFKQDGLFPPSGAPPPTAEEQAKNLASAERTVQVVTEKLFAQRPDMLEHVGLMFSFGVDILRLLCKWKREQQQAKQPGGNIALMLLTEGPRWLPQNRSVRMLLRDDASVAAAVALVEQEQGALDGLFVEFEEDMFVEGSKTQQNLIALTKQMPMVGVWFYEDQIDGMGTQLPNGKRLQRPCFEYLVEHLGVTFVNANIKRDDGKLAS